MRHTNETRILDEAPELYRAWLESGRAANRKPVFWRDRWVEKRVMTLITNLEKGTGVWRHRGGWAAYIRKEGRRSFLGLYPTRSTAVMARLSHMKPSWVTDDLWQAMRAKVLSRAISLDEP